MVCMVTDYLSVNSTQVVVEARLEGFSSLPVTATFAVSQRHLEGQATTTSASMHATLIQSQVRWDPFHQGLKSVAVELDSTQLQLLQSGALLIRLVNATNADVDRQRSFTIATQLPRKELTVSFDLQSNQVFYRNEVVTIPVKTRTRELSVPASMAYDFALTSGSFGTWLPRSRQKGSLQWDMPQDDQLQISIPVNWSNIPYEAEFHLQAQMKYLWNADVPDYTNQTIAHVFGVSPGQCPPGSFRSVNSSPVTLVWDHAVSTAQGILRAYSFCSSCWCAS